MFEKKLIKACVENNKALLKRILFLKSFCRVDLNAVSELGDTPLYISSREGHVELARLLIEKGADPNAVSELGDTPLRIASKKGHAALIALLIAGGADPNVLSAGSENSEDFDYCPMTPLHVAASLGRTDIARLLIEKGADPDVLSLYGHTAASVASEKGHAGVVRLLLDSKADIEAGSTRTPLHFAAYEGHAEVAKLLLEANASTEARDRFEHTVLMGAADRSNREDVVRLLLEHGADVKARSKEMQFTALHFAAAKGFSGIVALLLNAGGDPTARDAKGDTPVCYAQAHRHHDVVTLLLGAGGKVKTVESSTQEELMTSFNENILVLGQVCKGLIDNKVSWGLDSERGRMAAVDIEMFTRMRVAAFKNLLLRFGEGPWAEYIEENFQYDRVTREVYALSYFLSGATGHPDSNISEVAEFLVSGSAQFQQLASHDRGLARGSGEARAAIIESLLGGLG